MKVTINNLETGKNIDYSECRYIPRLGDIINIGVDGKREYVKVDSITHILDKRTTATGHYHKVILTGYYCKIILIHVKNMLGKEI